MKPRSQSALAFATALCAAVLVSALLAWGFLALLALAAQPDSPALPRVLPATPRAHQRNDEYQVPPVNIPAALRVPNYDGSCLWAAAVTLLAYQDRQDEADYWRRHFRGGAVIPPHSRYASVVETCRARGLGIAWTDQGNEQFLAWCSETRRGAVIHWEAPDRRGREWPGNHAVTFCGFTADRAYILDPNRTAQIQPLPRAAFLATWRECGGAALTFLYDPPEP